MEREERLRLLEDVKRETIKQSEETDSPIAEIVVIEDDNFKSRSYEVIFYFEHVEELMNLGELKLKDKFMGYFIRGLVKTGYPMGKHPLIQFKVDIHS